MDAFRECADRIRGTIPMTRFHTLLVSAEKVQDWAQRADRFAPALTGPGYVYVFVDYATRRIDPTDRRRVVADVTNTFVCQITRDHVGLKKNQDAPRVTPWLHSS